MDYRKLARDEVLQVRPYSPGPALDTLKAELALEEIILLASNECAYGPAESVKDAIRAELDCLHRYPEDGAPNLRQALASHLEVSQRRIFIGNGSVEILYLLATAFVKPGERIVYGAPSFVAYPIIAQISAGDGIAVPLDDDYRHDIDALISAAESKTRLLFLCNPINPTGTWNSEAQLRRLMEGVPEDVIVVLDEAYYEYVDAPDYPESLAWLERYPNLVILRTFSKMYSLAGLRVGYSVSDPSLASLLDTVRPSFNVSSVAQAAAIAALGEKDRTRTLQAEASRERRELARGINQLGCRVLPSQANFIMALLPVDASSFCEALLARGFFLRQLPSLPTAANVVRIGIGSPAENQRLLAAIKEQLTAQSTR